MDLKDSRIKQFEYKGYSCEVVAFMGHYNGYVDLPKTSPYFGKNTDDIPIECHGGLTYAKPNEKVWRIGFDCAHAWDLIDTTGLDPVSQEFLNKTNEIFLKMGGSFKDLEYVMIELKSIVDQLIEMDGA